MRHLRTKPYTPQNNVKTESYIHTALREWDHARTYELSSHRANHLPHRLHAGLQYQPPISRITALNNLVGLYS